MARTRLLPRRSAQDRHDVPADPALEQPRRSSRRQGVLLPGRSVREHLWASGVVREDPKLDRRGPEAPGAWDRLVEEINAWARHRRGQPRVLRRRQRRAGRPGRWPQLSGAEVHVVVTARDDAQPGHRPLAGVRQERLRPSPSTTTHVREDEPAGDDEWDWGTLDLADVLRAVGRRRCRPSGCTC